MIVTETGQGPFALLQPFGDHDTVIVESVRIVPAAGWATTVSLPAGGGSFNPVSAGPLDVTAFYSATDSGGIAAPVMNVLAPIIDTNTLTGSIDLVTGELELHINSVLMGTLPGAPFGETADLEIDADITWFGSIGVPIPEPSTGLLVGLGLVALAGRRQGSRRS